LLVAIVIRIVFSYISINPENPIYTVIHEITEPILAPIRQFIPRIGMFDLSPMVATFILILIIRAAMTLS
jgi:YggT family protein